MKQLLPLLALLLMAASCGTQGQPPASAPLPAEPPLRFRYDHTSGKLYYWPNSTYQGALLANYIEALDGSWRFEWYGIDPERRESNPASHFVDYLSSNDAYFVHYGLWNGRRLIWKYRFKVHTDQEPWRFEAPLGPVSLQEVKEFPWEPRYEANPRKMETLGYMNTAAMGGIFTGCLQKDLDNYLRRGIYIVNQSASTTTWRDIGQEGKTGLTLRWSWIDGVYEGFFGTDRMGTFFITNGRKSPSVPRFPSLDNRTHEVILLGYAEGNGPRSVEPWERRYFRWAGRNAGGFEEPDGSVRCEWGEWDFKEITDPAAIAWFDSWRTSTRQPPEGPLSPEQKAWLWPEGW